LVFSLTLASLIKAIGVVGLSAIHAIVCGLMYAFILLIVPDVRDNSLQEIEEFYRIITNTPLDKNFDSVLGATPVPPTQTIVSKKQGDTTSASKYICSRL